MPKKTGNYYKNSFDPAQRSLNIAQAMAEKLGIQTPIDKTFSVAISLRLNLSLTELEVCFNWQEYH